MNECSITANIPDWTLVWNVVDYLCISKMISNDAKIEVLEEILRKIQ